jgi:predicted Zn-dependent peptidase
MHHSFTLPGGLRVLVAPLPHTHSVSIGCFVGAGSGHEDSANSGIAHFIEHMLFKGSESRPTPKQISDAIEGVGGILDAYTSFDTTACYAKVADIHFERALDVLADMVLRPRFDPADVEKERRVIAEELRETEDLPAELVHLLLDQQMWGDQPLGRDIAGSPQSLAGFSHAQVVAHWRAHYTQQNTVISIAGNVEPQRAAALVAQAFAPMPTGRALPCLPSLPCIPGPKLVLRPEPSEQGAFCLGLPGVAFGDPDRRAMQVFDTVLGGGMSSRLFQEIREERGLAYTIGSDHSEYHDAGKWVVYGGVEPGKLAECVATIMTELRRARAEGISADELAQVKEQVKGGILLALEDTWSVASRNGTHALRYGQVIPIEQVVAGIEAVTQADVLRVARRVLREHGLHLAVIGPYKKKDERPLHALLRLE